MGCPVSKPVEQNGDIVSLCRERKRLIKSAVHRRFSLAAAHCKYIQSLYAVALAIRMFVARHSSTSSSFLITFPQPTDKTPESNSMYLQSQDSPISSLSSDDLERENSGVITVVEHEDGCDDDHKVDPPMPPPSYSFGWDFFDLFDVVNGFGQSYGIDDLTTVREAEGIPELEEDVERENSRERNVVVAEEVKQSEVGDGKTGGDANVSQGEEMGVGVIGEETNGRELLEALKDVEDHFIRVCESGFDVSKLLEANVVNLQSGLEEIKESPNKIIQSITWRISSSSQSSKSSSTCTEFKDEYGGMESGICLSHSSTIGKLYAWEKKLYEQVKAGYEMRKIYERKCSYLSNKDTEAFSSVDKTEAEIRSLYSRILVTMRSANSISKRIQKLRDQELQPQLLELLHGLMQTWRVMFESHQAQNQTMSEVKSFTTEFSGNNFIKGSHRLSTLQLETELQNWRSCFSNYVFSQKSYIQALDAYLSKSIVPRLNEPSSQIDSPPLLDICHDWLDLINSLPDKKVTDTMKSFANDIRGLWAQQGVEEQHKRKVDELITELERRVKSVEEKKGILLGEFKNRVDEEKAKHQELVQETMCVGLHAFQRGFFPVFESLAEFSRACVDMYSVLVANGENAKERLRTLSIHLIRKEEGPSS